MVRRSAGHNEDLVDVPDLLIRHVQVPQHHLTTLDAGGSGLPDGTGLLVDLLEHEVLVPALLGGGHVPVHMAVFLLDGAHLAVVYPDALSTENGQLAVVQIGDVPCVADDGRHVGGDHVLSLTEAQQQRRILPGAQQTVRVVGADDAQSIGPVHGVEHPDHGLKDVAAVGIVVVQQLGYHLRVRLGPKAVALVEQLLLQLGVVFDNAVVYHSDAATLAHMGVGVDVIGLPVGGPAGVTDAQMARQIRPVVGQIAEHLQPATGLLHPQLPIAAHGDARRVVAPVLQTAQTVQQDGSRFLLAHVSYNSAHILKFLLKSLDSSAHADTQSIRMSHSGHSLSVLRSPAYLPAASRTRSGTGELPPKRSILSPPRCPAGGQALALVMGYSHGLLSLLRLYKNSPGCFYRG